MVHQHLIVLYNNIPKAPRIQQGQDIASLKLKFQLVYQVDRKVNFVSKMINSTKPSSSSHQTQ